MSCTIRVYARPYSVELLIFDYIASEKVEFLFENESKIHFFRSIFVISKRFKSTYNIQASSLLSGSKQINESIKILESKVCINTSNTNTFMKSEIYGRKRLQAFKF